MSLDDYHLCDLCGLNRSTLHLDETIEGTLQATAHLCDDCWYRLGIRIPLGNIWHHIQRHKQELSADPLDSLDDSEVVDKRDNGLDHLLHSGALSLAEPENPAGSQPADFADNLRTGDKCRQRGPDPVDLEGFLENVDPQEEILKEAPSLGTPSVKIGRIHPALVSLLPHDLLVHHKAIPVSLKGATLTVAFADPSDKLATANIEMYAEKLGFSFVAVEADEFDILRELEHHTEPPKTFESLS